MATDTTKSPLTPTPTDVGTLSGPELDAAVWAALGYPVLRTWAAGAFYDDAKRLAKAAGKDRVYVLDNGVGHFWLPFSEFKPPTLANVSSDANAMMLLIAAMVKLGWRVQIETFPAAADATGPGYMAFVAHPKAPDDEDDPRYPLFDETAGTAMVAVCRAALKALAAGGGK